MTWTRAVFVPAFAKVNLTLEVLGRRDDGYHDLASVMQTISLCDTLALHPAPPGELSLTCDVAELSGADNLALRAAQAIAADVRADGRAAGGVHIELHKRTPTQAGLGGGSSDAAAALLSLPQLLGAELALHHLLRIAAALGSDVPFFLTAGTALVTGRGERVAPLPDLPPHWLVLVKPQVGVPTGKAFAALTASDHAEGAHSAAVADALSHAVALPAGHMVNSFEQSVRRDYPAVEETWQHFRSAGAHEIHLSGSGPTLFALFTELTAAAAVWRRLRAGGHASWLAHTVAREAALAAVSAQLAGEASQST